MNKDRYVSARVVSTDPAVIYSMRGYATPLGVASLRPEAFRDRKVLHLLSLASTIETEDAPRKVAKDLQAASAEFPDNTFVVLTNTEFEAYLLSELGVVAMPCSLLTFLDENLFVPMGGPPEFDAVYNARLIPLKRHELAREVASLALLYDLGPPEKPSCYDDVRAMLPRATFINHQVGEGAYKQLRIEECVRHINRARVGLCLSASEGPMQASMEYMLAGLPIVSTRSLGGRDRYLLPPFCRMVDDDPAAVAQAVEAYVKKPIPKQVVRDHALFMLRFERHNFLIAVNKLVKQIFGVESLFKSFAPFEIGLTRWRSPDQAVAPLMQQPS
jgi:glycosyltransferase involved in cell wall biosynthesis